MADPESCPNYDEESNRDYINDYPQESLEEVTQLESERLGMGFETDIEAAKRADEHIRSIGVESRIIETKEEVEEAPEWF